MNQLEKMIREDKDNLSKAIKKQDQDVELSKIKNQIDKIKQFPNKIKEALTGQPKINIDMVKVQKLTVKLEKRQKDYGDNIQFKASVNRMNDEILTSEVNSVIIISFNKKLFDGFFEEGGSYTISGVIKESKSAIPAIHR